AVRLEEARVRSVSRPAPGKRSKAASNGRAYAGRALSTTTSSHVRGRREWEAGSCLRSLKRLSGARAGSHTRERAHEGESALQLGRDLGAVSNPKAPARSGSRRRRSPRGRRTGTAGELPPADRRSLPVQ